MNEMKPKHARVKKQQMKSVQISLHRSYLVFTSLDVHTYDTTHKLQKYNFLVSCKTE